MAMPYLEAVSAIHEPSLVAQAGPQAVQAAPAGTVGFGQMVSSGLQQVNSQLQAAQADLQSLAAGDTANLHAVMIRMEEGRLSFQLMLQVRNRLLESYQELMRMQI